MPVLDAWCGPHLVTKAIEISRFSRPRDAHRTWQQAPAPNTEHQHAAASMRRLPPPPPAGDGFTLSAGFKYLSYQARIRVSKSIASAAEFGGRCAPLT